MGFEQMPRPAKKQEEVVDTRQAAESQVASPESTWQQYVALQKESEAAQTALEAADREAANVGDEIRSGTLTKENFGERMNQLAEIHSQAKSRRDAAEQAVSAKWQEYRKVLEG